MAKKTETIEMTPAEMLRKGWLAYLGLYGAAYERVKPLTTKAGAALEDLIAKGETVETGAQEIATDVKTRAQGVYGDGVARVRKYMPKFGGEAARVEELEAEVAALNKKVSALTKKTPAKRAAKAA